MNVESIQGIALLPSWVSSERISSCSREVIGDGEDTGENCGSSWLTKLSSKDVLSGDSGGVDGYNNDGSFNSAINIYSYIATASKLLYFMWKLASYVHIATL